MNWSEYLEIFEGFENNPTENPLNYTESQIGYTSLNKKRQERWLKKIQFDETTIAFFNNLPSQHWIVITEAWCGDSAHILPILYKLTELNENIRFEIDLRDTGQYIESYLTNGARAVPKVIMRDKNGKDIATFGPRPSELAALISGWKAELSQDDFNKNVQMWYNKNKGKAIISDIMTLLT